MTSPDSSDDYMDKLLSIFEDQLKKKKERKEVHEEEDVEENELIRHGLKKKYLAREVTARKNQRSRRKELAEVHRDLGFVEKCPLCCMYELTGNLQDSP
ncbi:hypothetical protein Q3G72_012664 [Acer saccharum]|nr:hypothetical protein Q3G72_012664 [Acer saccharum]